MGLIAKNVDEDNLVMAARRVFLRFMRSKLGFTFIVILILALFLLMLNSYSNMDTVHSDQDSGSRRGLNAFVDEYGVFHPGVRHKSKHRKAGTSEMEVPVCQIPNLTLDNDANKHAYKHLDALECPGEQLFYIKNGEMRLNYTVLKGRHLERCEYTGIVWGNDKVFDVTNTLIKKEEPFELGILHDFIRVKCYLKHSKEGHHRKLLSNSPEQKQQQQVAEKKIVLHSPRLVGSVGLPDMSDALLKPAKSEAVINEKAENQIRKLAEDREGAKEEEELAEQQKLAYDQGDDTGMDEQSDDGSYDSPDYEQFIAQIVPSEEAIKQAKELMPSTDTPPLNILIFALDSMSHLCYQRKLPETYAFLKNELGSFILGGYNIVGDATTAAMIPLLTGKTEQELPETRVNHDASNYVDVYPFIWNKFEQNGYVTLYAEDMPSFGTFQLRMNGFEEPPVHHYMRPFWQASLSSSVHENSPEFCLGAKPEHQYTLNYIKQFFSQYKSLPKFALSFIGELSHADNDPAQYIDRDLVEFLKAMQKSGALDSTLLVVMGDHGARYSKVRKSFQGKLEERLPMMSLHFPKSFKEKHKKEIDNLKKNVLRLTTPFDVHETLRDVLDMSRLDNPFKYSDRGISLLKEIPLNRTCSAAGIDIHWCTCLHYKEMDVKDTIVQRISTFMIKQINLMTSGIRGQCEELELEEIMDAQIVVPNEKVLKFQKTIDPDQRIANFSSQAVLDIAHYQLVVATQPNSAWYEATVQYRVKDKSMQLMGTISRLDRYKDQPACIVNTHPDLRKYCMCKQKTLT